tara:strand:+ start:63 stop:272 length:210 start_codon:yes stop_codon:yes gene_type:complete
MRFINSEQIKHKNAVKDGDVVRKNRDNLITVPTGTTISFGELLESRGNYSITMTATKGRVSKTIILPLR